MQYREGLVALNNGSTVGSNYTLTAITTGTMAAGTYYYVLSVIYPAGESVKSVEKSITLSGSQKGVKITWDAVPGASKYRIYRGTSSGGQNKYFETTNTTFEDIGGTGTTGTPLTSSDVAQYVVGYNTQFLNAVTPGCIFKRQGENVTYQVASVINNTLLKLSSSYAGTGTLGAEYQIVRDFTQNFGFTEIWAGDADWAYHLTMGTIRKIDELLATYINSVRTVSSNITLDSSYGIVLVNAYTTNRTITLPNAVLFAQKQYIIIKVDSSSNTVTISPQAGQTINGETSHVLSRQYQSIWVVSDGNNWIAIN